MLTREYTRAGHVARFIITRDAREGWEVREEQDERIVSRTNYRDWHRVERAIQAFERQADLLENPGPA